MSTAMQTLTVVSEEQLESAILSFIAQGYVISNRTQTSVTLFKKKEFSVLWAVVGIVLCVIPLLIYLIVYATQTDQMVVIRIAAGGEQAQGRLSSAADVIWSDDRSWWWDGTAWRDADREIPPTATLSADSQYWWDGRNWRAMPRGALGQLDAPGGAPRQAEWPPDEG